MSDDGIILEKKKQKVTPGEMESIVIKKDMLTDVNNLDFRLEVL